MEKFQVFNLSTMGTTSVRRIAQETTEVLTRGKTVIRYGSSPVGWLGDVPKTRLDMKKMTALGWGPRLDSTMAVVRSIRAYIEWSSLRGS